MADNITLNFSKLLGFRHVITLAGGSEFSAGGDQPGETIAAMAKAAGAIFNKGGELATCESQGVSSRLPRRDDATD
jgi:hypothetical protein